MATGWRLAKSLEALRSQVNLSYPNRSKKSDGTIGDTSHASSASDHNPNRYGVVTALDLTHDPSSGFDAHAMAEAIRNNPHPEAKYLISSGRIAGDFNGWKWQRYNGTNPHSSHVHISVGSGSDGQSQPPYDSENKWNIGDSSMLNQELVTRLFFTYLGRAPKQEDAHWIGKPTNDLVITLESSPERQQYVESLRAVPKVETVTKPITRDDVIAYIKGNLK